MTKHHLICLALIAGILCMSRLPALAQRAVEGKPIAETEKEKRIILPPSDKQKEKLFPKDSEPPDQKLLSPVGMPVYHPPLRGAPGGRIGGGTRGIGDELIGLCALAPNHVGLTVQEQPTLYWFLSKPTKHPIEVTIILEEATHPLLEKSLTLPVQPGIYALSLKDLDVRLSIATPYRWFVALVPHPDRRSQDILAGGMIERIELSEALRVKLSQADRREAHQIYAESGIWYDTIMAISELIAGNPNDSTLRNQRAALLEQVGLSEVAQYEMKQGIPVKE
jgi:hypothetical protein